MNIAVVVGLLLIVWCVCSERQDWKIIEDYLLNGKVPSSGSSSRGYQDGMELTGLDSVVNVEQQGASKWEKIGEEIDLFWKEIASSWIGIMVVAVLVGILTCFVVYFGLQCLIKVFSRKNRNAPKAKKGMKLLDGGLIDDAKDEYTKI